MDFASLRLYLRVNLWRNMVLKIVTVNFVVWMAIGLVMLLSNAGPTLIDVLAVPGNPASLPYRWWTPLTYMVVQTDFLHLMVNMLWLMLLGRVFMHMTGERHLLALYIYGGLGGAAAFVAYSAAVSAYASMLYGASCAVMAVCGAVMLMAPRWQVDLLIIGRVKLLWVCMVCIVFFVIFNESMYTNISHAGGVVVGLVYALCRKGGIDICKPLVWVINRLAALTPGRGVPTARPYYTDNAARPRPQHSPRPKAPRNNYSDLATSVGGNVTTDEHRELDSLLTKVSRSGYSSLSPYERQRLFDLSRKIKI